MAFVCLKSDEHWKLLRGIWCHLLWQMSSQWGSQKILQGLVSHELTAYLSIFNQFKLILSKACKPDNFELNHSLKLSFINIWGLHSNFVDFESSLESNSPDIFALCETNLDGSIDSGNFSVRGYLPLIWKDSSTHMHGLTVYVKEGLAFAWGLSLENSTDSYLCFWLALLRLVSYFFSLYISPSLSLSMVFDLISSHIDQVFSVNPSINVFVFRDFKGSTHYIFLCNPQKSGTSRIFIAFLQVTQKTLTKDIFHWLEVITEILNFI